MMRDSDFSDEWLNLQPEKPGNLEDMAETLSLIGNISVYEDYVGNDIRYDIITGNYTYIYIQGNYMKSQYI